MADYAFLIHLDPTVVPRHFQALHPSTSALASRPRTSVLSSSTPEGTSPHVSFDPVSLFVSQLQVGPLPRSPTPVLTSVPPHQITFPSTFLLFHSPEGHIVIGGIWNPSAEPERQWKIGLGFPCRPVEGTEEKAKVVLDKDEVMREIERLGTGLVVRTEILLK